VKIIPARLMLVPPKTFHFSGEVSFVSSSSDCPSIEFRYVRRAKAAAFVPAMRPKTAPSMSPDPLG
jgi:hypothetical protein